MGIELSISIRVVIAVHDSVGTRAHVGRALCNVSADEEHTLPALAHLKRAMCGVAMLKKSLEEQRQIPNRYEKKEDGHTNQFLAVEEKFTLSARVICRRNS